MPPKSRKRKSDQSIASEMDDATTTTAGQKVATKMDSTGESPTKRRKVGVTIAQKQALIDNLQLEVTERARKLRAQYNLQAQGLRTRIEIRVNRIPIALRRLKMGDLLHEHSTDQQKPVAPKQPTASTAAGRAPPPVPEKDFNPARSVAPRAESSSRTAQTAVNRPLKRLSDQLATGDKENQNAHLDNPKKRQRGGNHPATAHGTQPGQVLSPASSNSRLNPRDRERTAAAPPSPAKSFIARPMSPTKQPSTSNLLSSMVEKARATRAATTRKPTTSSTASSSAGGSGTTASRTRGKGATAATPASRSAAAAASRNARRISGISESSDASTSTVVRKVGRPTTKTAAASTSRKVTTTAAATPSTKRTVMSSIKKGVASATTKRAPTAKAAATTTTASATTRSGRVLRKRD